jgi:TonB family protein
MPGLILLEVVVSREGRVRSVKALRNPEDLNVQRAAEAIRQWEFQPGTLHGQPVDVVMNITVNIHW